MTKPDLPEYEIYKDLWSYATVLREQCFPNAIDAGRKFGISHTTIYRYEGGGGNPSTPPLGYLANLTCLIIERQQDFSDIEDRKAFLKKQLNSLIRHNKGRVQYKDKAPFSTWHQIETYAKTWLKDRRGEKPLAPDSKKDQALQRAYLRYVLQNSSQLLLTSIDPKIAGIEPEARLQLNKVYIALLTLNTAPIDKRQWSALNQLNKHRHLVLLGDPGSGKTTFVNFVASCLAGEALGSKDTNLRLLTTPLPDDQGNEGIERQEWTHEALLPVKVQLREFAASDFLPPDGEVATADHLWNFIVNELGQGVLRDNAAILRETLFVEGGLLLLLDGLDEIPDAHKQRPKIIQAIENFALVFEHCRILVTSRTYAYQKQDWRLSEFKVAVLDHFHPGQIRQFIRRWYEYVGRLRGLGDENSQGRAVQLVEAIFRNEQLEVLAKRPLLLTLMASLHAWREGSLPEDRVELYEDTVDLLLNLWERQRVIQDAFGQIIDIQPSMAEYLKVGRKKILQLLQELAYEVHLHQANEQQNSADINEGVLLSRLTNLTSDPGVNPARLVEYLRDRTGLLIPRGVGVYAFPHRTFQEYLAACYLTDANYPETLVDLVNEDINRWREVALLAGAKAARGTKAAVWYLVDALCSDADNWKILLAGQLLIDTIDDLSQIRAWDRPKLKPVQTGLVNIVEKSELSAAEWVLAGQLLGHLGDPRPGVGVSGDNLPDIKWIEIPAGSFIIGSDPEKDTFAEEHETPQHELYLPEFSISCYPITNRQFKAFVDDGGYRDKRYWQDVITAGGWQEGKIKVPVSTDGGNAATFSWLEIDPRNRGKPFNLPNYPVVGITWYEAVAFCKWLTLRLQANDQITSQQVVRLPTEAQWEKAARGENGLMFPWGDQPDPDRASHWETSIRATKPVGCFATWKSPCGVSDCAGNIWEWCTTQAGEDIDRLKFKPYPYNTEEDEWAGDYLKGAYVRAVRGGSWGFSDINFRCAARDRHYPYRILDQLGFRVVLSSI